MVRGRKGATMNQADLMQRLVEGAGLTQPQAAQVLRVLLESIQLAL
jgi:nucleoid DNA-binding protein